MKNNNIIGKLKKSFNEVIQIVFSWPEKRCKGKYHHIVSIKSHQISKRYNIEIEKTGLI